jgi:hypothetical protein
MMVDGYQLRIGAENGRNERHAYVINISVSLVFVFIYVYVYLQNTKLVIYMCHECALQPTILRCLSSRNLALLDKKFCACVEAVSSNDTALNNSPLVIGRYNHTAISNLAVSNTLL